MKRAKTNAKRKPLAVVVQPVVRDGWSVKITRADKTWFMASGGVGVVPPLWPLSQRSLAVAYKRELIEHGFNASVIRVRWGNPIHIPNARLEPRGNRVGSEPLLGDNGGAK